MRCVSLFMVSVLGVFFFTFHLQFFCLLLWVPCCLQSFLFQVLLSSGSCWFLFPVWFFFLFFLALKHFLRFPFSYSTSYRQLAEGSTKSSRWHPLLHQRRPPRVATDASWVMSLTVLCLGSLPASPPSSSRQLQLKPASTSPSEQNWLPSLISRWNDCSWNCLSWEEQ